MAICDHCEASAKETTAHVRLCSEYNQHDDFAALRLLQRCKTTLMAESPTYFNAVRPVLRALRAHGADAAALERDTLRGTAVAEALRQHVPRRACRWI